LKKSFLALFTRTRDEFFDVEKQFFLTLECLMDALLMIYGGVMLCNSD
jgi:hypothetical protein